MALAARRVKPGARIVRSCCRSWLPGPWSALPGLQLFAAWLLQRVQLFAARLMQLLQLFAARFALPGGCRALPGPWSACLVPVAAERCLVAAWWLPAELVAQLRPVAAWSRSCCLVVFVFVIQGCRCL